ncbi:glycosyltransferase family protein [Citrifermentans bemidjiense]|uniref:glycosyltransferase family 39 protein n=1 Tax=Citrifermentans bemidjiense TaxID=225194 RepID=UPI0011D0F940|nr:glycosyltransferase family 39 protein [Citrifermentans bemidjiense]
MLLIAVVLAAYYPAMLGGFHTIDDPGIVSFYSNSPSLSHVLLPSRGYYYRPLIEFSFWLDNLLWGMEPRVMHLENILLHMANVVLVFLCSRRVSSQFAPSSPLVSLFASLLFALHPLNVEAVGWVAGRTDPLLALFVLSCCYFLLKWLDESNWRHAAWAFVLFICAVLTKETALAFLPVAVLLILKWPLSPRSLSYRQRLTISCTGMASGLLFLAVALFLRGRATAAAQLLAPGDAGVLRLIRECAVAFGFYLKKLLLPLPLNFALTDVSPAYGVVGAIGGLLLLYALLKRRELAPLFLSAAALMAMPAIFVALRDISWTPYAERYMYLPTAFLSLAAACLLFARQQKVLSGLAPFLVLLLSWQGVITLKRNILWQDKLLFYQDAAAKSPAFGSIYNELGVLMLQNNRRDEAVEAFAKADRLNKRPSMTLPIRANVMRGMLAKGDCAGARTYFFRLFGMKKDAPAEFLEILQAADAKRAASLAADEKALAFRDLIDTYLVLYQKTTDPFWLYQGGKTARALKSYPEAAGFFQKAYAEAPAGSHYRLAAGKQASSLVNMK